MATYRGPYYRLNAYQEPAIPEGLTELRVHGVNGAPPEQLLHDPHPILVSGDDTAAFYRSREKPSGELERTVEAYSWTGLAPVRSGSCCSPSGWSTSLDGLFLTAGGDAPH